MEINLQQQIPETGLQVTNSLPAVSPLPVDNSFVMALSGKKIRDALPGEVLEAVSAAVEKAWFDRSLKPIDDGDMKQLKVNITKDYISCFGSMTLDEIGNAFHHWVRGKYGKFYTVSVADAGEIMSKYLTDQTRLEAVQSVKPKELSANPTIDERFNLGRYSVWIAFEKYNSKKAIGTVAPTAYNFLNQLGLIIYSKEEKWDFMQKGLLAAIDEIRISIATTTDEHNLAGMKRQLTLLLEANQPDTALKDADCITLVKNKAKELTLVDWFSTCLENEFDIGEMVDAKRENYLKINT